MVLHDVQVDSRVSPRGEERPGSYPITFLEDEFELLLIDGSRTQQVFSPSVSNVARSDATFSISMGLSTYFLTECLALIASRTGSSRFIDLVIRIV